VSPNGCFFVRFNLRTAATDTAHRPNTLFSHRSEYEGALFTAANVTEVRKHDFKISHKDT
jgi:hypothetical protein